MAANKKEKPKSEVEKKFDDLLNDKCSWTYKSVKTIKCQTRRQSEDDGSLFKIRTVNIEETAYNRDSRPKNDASPMDEYDYIETVTKKEEKKNVKQKPIRKSRTSKIAKFDSIKGNRNSYQPEAAFDVKRQMNETAIKRNRRNLKDISYAESDSSSDDGLVFLSRRYDGKTVNGADSDVNETFQEENSSFIDADENKIDLFDSNSFEIPEANFGGNYSEMDNFKAYDNEIFEPQDHGEINATNYHSDQEKSYNILDFLFDDDYEKSNSSINPTENQVQSKESPSETLSSLSEGDSSKFEESKRNGKPTRKERIVDANRKYDQDSEIIKQFMTVNSEVQALCNDLEAPNDDGEDDIVKDFFSGNFSVEKYRSKANTDKTASITKERNENCIDKSELLNETSLEDSSQTYSDRGISFNEGIPNRTTRLSDSARGTDKEKRKTPSSKMNFNFKKTAKGRKQYTGGDSISSEQSNEYAADNGEFGGNEYSKTYSNNRNSVDTKYRKQNGKELNTNKNALYYKNSFKSKDPFDNDSTSSVRGSQVKGKDKLGEKKYSPMHLVMDSPKTYLDARKHTNKDPDNEEDIKGKRGLSDNKINPKNKSTSNVKPSNRVKGQHWIYTDSDLTSLGLSSEEDTGNDVLIENECSAMDNYFKENSFNVHENNSKQNKNVHNQDNFENSNSSVTKMEQNDTKGEGGLLHNKINSRNKSTSNVKRSNRVKGQHWIYTDSDHASSAQSSEEDTESVSLIENVCSEMDNYFKENSFNVHEKSRKQNKNVHNRDKFENGNSVTKMEQNGKNTNARQLMNKSKKDTNFKLPELSDVAKHSATSKTEVKENVPFNKNKDGGEVKSTKKKAPKTWEDLEADILNREEQISFFHLEEKGYSPVFETVLEDEKSYHTGTNKSRSSSHGSNISSGIGKKKTENKWAVVKSEPRHSGMLASGKNVNKEATFDSPNASIIDRVIRRMQLCTSPVLTPNKVQLPTEEHQDSPIQTKYSSYSVQETKSVIFKAEKKLNDKQVGLSKTTSEASTEKNYRIYKKQEIKTVINPKGRSITNQTSVKLKEIPRKNPKLSKSSDDETVAVSNDSSEMKIPTSESDESISFPQKLYASDGKKSYNLRKRKCKDNSYKQRTAKKRSITKVNNATKDKANKQNLLPLIEKPMTEDDSSENLPITNKRKRGNKSNFTNSFAYNTDQSESEDSSINGALNIDSIPDKQDRCHGKGNTKLKLTKTNNEEMSSQTNTLLSSEDAKTPAQSSQKQERKVQKSLKAEKPKRDSKAEYEIYLQKLFTKDLAEDFDYQGGISDENIQKKEIKIYSSEKRNLTDNSDEDLFSLSSDTESEEEIPSSRKASGLLGDLFN